MTKKYIGYNQWKRFRLTSFLRSKVGLPFLSFFLGYFIHFLMSNGKADERCSYPSDLSTEAHPQKDGDLLLVVLIFSSLNNFKKRLTIRETWLSDILERKEVKHYFVISQGNAKEDQRVLISVEQNKYNDLLILPKLEDSFYLLTPKLMASFGWITGARDLNSDLRSLGHSNKTFNTFKFMLKCDDDSFVRITEIINELNSVYSGSKGENLYWGFFDGRARAKKTGKYKEEEWNICDHYTPYALGGGYILARPLVHFIARNEQFLKKYRNEDVSVGAWLSSYQDINRVHDPRFDTEYLSRGCHQTYLITHKHSEIAMRNLYDNLKKTGRLCRKEFKTRMSYIYNWASSPSNCCNRINPNIP